MSLHADLASVLSSLDQVLERLEEAAELVDDDRRADVVADLHEVERHVRSASRRLTRTVASLPSPGTGT